jgi:hypothetical protein
MWPFAADEDPHTVRPFPQVERSGQLGDVAAIADFTGGVDSCSPDALGH